MPSRTGTTVFGVSSARGVYSAENRACVPQQKPTNRIEPQCPAIPVEKRLANDGFKTGDLKAQRRLAARNTSGRRCQRAAIDYRNERAKQWGGDVRNHEENSNLRPGKAQV
jgi:hypothetical protein